MALLSPSTLENHPAGTLNVGGIINDNWAKLNKIFDPALSGADPLFGLIAAAVRGQGGGVKTLSYAGTVDLDFTDEEIQAIALTGDVTFTFSNLAAGRNLRLLIGADATLRNIVWPAGVNWVAEETLTIDANAYLVVELISQATTATDVWATVGGGAGGGGGAAGLAYKWSTDTAATDPTAGYLKVNNATLGSASVLRISETDNDTNNIANYIGAWDDGTSNQKGVLSITDEADPTNFAIFEVTGAITDDGAWRTANIDLLASGGTLTNDLAVRVLYARTGDKGEPGFDGGLTYGWEAATSGDPGTGLILANNATIASVTQLNISETDGDAADVSGLLATWDDSTNTVKGQILIRDRATPGNFAVFNVNGNLTDIGTYWTIPVAYVGSGGTLADGAALSVEFTRAGDKGNTGANGSTTGLGTIYALIAGNYTL